MKDVNEGLARGRRSIITIDTCLCDISIKKNVFLMYYWCVPGVYVSMCVCD